MFGRVLFRTHCLCKGAILACFEICGNLELAISYALCDLLYLNLNTVICVICTLWRYFTVFHRGIYTSSNKFRKCAMHLAGANAVSASSSLALLRHRWWKLQPFLRGHLPTVDGTTYMHIDFSNMASVFWDVYSRKQHTVWDNPYLQCLKHHL